MLLFLAGVLGFISGAFLLVQIGICLFFAIPTTINLYEQGLLKSKQEIIQRYILSILILSLIYSVVLCLVCIFGNASFLKVFILSGLSVFIIGRIKGPIFRNENNMKEYLQMNKKYFSEQINQDKLINLKKKNDTSKKSLKVPQDELQKLMLKIRTWANSGRGTPNSFFDLFQHLKLKEHYVFDYVIDSENIVYPYIRKDTDAKIKNVEDYEEFNSNYFEDTSDKSFFEKNMDKIELDESPISFYELVVFNYYVKIFFFPPDEYGGKIISNEAERNAISNRIYNGSTYTSEQKNIIRNIQIPEEIVCKNKEHYVSIICTDASFGINEVVYRITEKNHLILEKEDPVVPPFIFF